MNIGDSPDSEVVLAVKVSVNDKSTSKRLIVIMVYMMVKGERGVRETRGKYGVMRKVVREYAGEKVIIMGDMNAHVGVLGKIMNLNGEMLDEFMDDLNLQGIRSLLLIVLVNGKMCECVSCVDR